MRTPLPLLPLLLALAAPPLAAATIQLPKGLTFKGLQGGSAVDTRTCTLDELMGLLAALETERKGPDQDQWRAAAAQVKAAMRAAEFKPLAKEAAETKEGTSSRPARIAFSATARPWPKGWIATRVLRWEDHLGGATRLKVAPPARKGEAFSLVGLAGGQAFRLTLDGQRQDLVRTNQGVLPWKRGDGGLDQPWDVAVLPDGRVEILTARGDLFRLGEDGTPIPAASTRFPERSNLAVGPEGQRYLWNDHGIWRLDPDAKGALQGRLLAGTTEAPRKRLADLRKDAPALGLALQIGHLTPLRDGTLAFIHDMASKGEVLCRLAFDKDGPRVRPIQALQDPFYRHSSLAVDMDGGLARIFQDSESEGVHVQTGTALYGLQDAKGEPLQLEKRSASHGSLLAVPGGFMVFLGDQLLYFEDPSRPRQEGSAILAKTLETPSRRASAAVEATPGLVPPFGLDRLDPMPGWIQAPWTPGGQPLPAGVTRFRVVPPTKEEAALGHPFALVCLAEGDLFRLAWDGRRTDLVERINGNLPWEPYGRGLDLPVDFLVQPGGTILCFTGSRRAYRLEQGRPVPLGRVWITKGFRELFQDAEGRGYVSFLHGIMRVGVDAQGELVQSTLAGAIDVDWSLGDRVHHRRDARDPMHVETALALPDGRIVLQSKSGADTEFCQLVEHREGLDLVPIQKLDELLIARNSVELLPRGEDGALLLVHDKWHGRTRLLAPEGRYSLWEGAKRPLAGRRFQPVPGGYLGLRDRTFVFMEDPGGNPDGLNLAFHDGQEAVKAGNEEGYLAALARIVELELAGLPGTGGPRAEVDALLDDVLGKKLRGIVQGQAQDPWLPLRAKAALRTLEEAWERRDAERKAP